MSQTHHNPYAKTAQNLLDTNDDENVSMHDSSHLKTFDSEGSKNEAETGAEDESQQHMPEEEEITFKENPFQIPPSFNRPITEETLRDNDHPYVFWASLRLGTNPFESDQPYGGGLRHIGGLRGAHGRGRSPVCNFPIPFKRLRIN